jgi:hypothetical protein
MNACQKEMMACQEATEAHLEKIEANPEEMKSVVKHQKVPEEETVVETIGALEDRYLAVGRHRQPAKWTQGGGGSWQKLAAAQGWLTCQPFLQCAKNIVIRNQARTMLTQNS